MKGIIFDLDGTMVDNMTIHHRAWQRKLASLGLELTFEEVKEKVHGVNEEIIYRLFGDRFTFEECQRIAAEKEAEYREIFLEVLKLINGLDEFLRELSRAKIPMAIGTAAPIENVDFIMDNLNIRHYFNPILHAGSVTKGKPDPEIYEKAAKGLGVEPKDCFVFEDSPTGAATANKLGIPTIIVTTTHSKEEFEKYPNVVGFIKDYSGMTVESLSSFLV